jgi:flagellar biosynthesis/type III secretory pathway M-ring protein FliF/YscJ
MEKIIDFLPVVLWVLVLLVIWYFIRNVLIGLSDRINNSELYKEDMLTVLEEIRDELKELNKNNSVK